MSWIWRARIDKRCCDVRDVKETDQGHGELARNSEWRRNYPTLAQGSPVRGGEMIHQEATEAIIIMNGAWKVAGTVSGATI